MLTQVLYFGKIGYIRQILRAPCLTFHLDQCFISNDRCFDSGQNWLFSRFLTADPGIGRFFCRGSFRNNDFMKSPTVENIVVDEVHDRTYVVMAHRTLTDGELYRAIRIELLKRGGATAKGERIVITEAAR